MTFRCRWAGAIGTVLLLVAVLVGVTPAPAQSATDGTGGKYAGMYVLPFLTHDSALELGRIHSTGSNTIAFSIYWYVDQPTDNTMQRGQYTVSDERLIADITNAHAQGMKVALAPTLICSACVARWRGNLHPSDPATFFNNYRQMMLHYVKLAGENGVELFFVGTEMKSLEGADYTDEWDQMITESRALFTGQLSYNMNWDSLTGPQFWDKLDLISLSAFMPLTGVEHPAVADFKAGWKASPIWGGEHWFDDLAALHRRYGKPVMFGESGYMSSTFNGRRPYDDTDTHDAEQAAQANAYQALLETFEPQSWWAGVLWWEWIVTAGDPASTDRTPRGKQAEQLLTKWYAQGWRPAAGTTETTTPNAPHHAADPNGRSGGPVPVVPKVAKPQPKPAAAAPVTTTSTPAQATTTTAQELARGDGTTGTPDTSDPLAGFDKRMQQQQAFIDHGASLDNHIRRAGKIAGILIVMMLMGHAAFAFIRFRFLPVPAKSRRRF